MKSGETLSPFVPFITQEKVNNFIFNTILGILCTTHQSRRDELEN